MRSCTGLGSVLEEGFQSKLNPSSSAMLTSLNLILGSSGRLREYRKSLQKLARLLFVVDVGSLPCSS